jgi:hypothetical protein
LGFRFSHCVSLSASKSSSRTRCSCGQSPQASPRHDRGAAAICDDDDEDNFGETVSGRRGAGPTGEIPVAEAVAIKRRRTDPKAAKEAAMRTADKYIPRRKT